MKFAHPVAPFVFGLSFPLHSFAGSLFSAFGDFPDGPHYWHSSPKPYFIKENIVGSGFYTSFDWQAIPDPTNGRVNYVDQPTSMTRNLTFSTADTFILRTDFKTQLTSSGAGRDSVRIRSKNTYATHVAVFDVRHMPQGCGTWPAIWETKESNWPTGGEVDIVEGVNDVGTNSAALHTTQGCTMPQSRAMTGASKQLDCDWLKNYNSGCGVAFPGGPKPSYGPAFNANGGGWFVMERTETYINIWFWGRNDPSVPREVKEGSAMIYPRKFGIPAAHYPNTSCDIKKHFDRHNIIINLTLCGDWAGEHYTYTGAGCPSSCRNHVESNPGAFKEAYFDIGSVRVYEDS